MGQKTGIQSGPPRSRRGTGGLVACAIQLPPFPGSLGYVCTGKLRLGFLQDNGTFCIILELVNHIPNPWAQIIKNGFAS